MNFRLTYKVDGKTVTESLPDQAATPKAEREIAEFRKLQALHKEFVEVNMQICRMCPAEPDARLREEKNGRSDLPRSHARSRAIAAHHLRRSPQDGASGFRGHRNGGALGDASSWSRSADIAIQCMRRLPMRLAASQVKWARWELSKLGLLNWNITITRCTASIAGYPRIKGLVPPSSGGRP